MKEPILVVIEGVISKKERDLIKEQWPKIYEGLPVKNRESVQRAATELVLANSPSYGR